MNSKPDARKPKRFEHDTLPDTETLAVDLMRDSNASIVNPVHDICEVYWTGEPSYIFNAVRNHSQPFVGFELEDADLRGLESLRRACANFARR
jgi:hypothetical protein